MLERKEQYTIYPASLSLAGKSGGCLRRANLLKPWSLSTLHWFKLQSIFDHLALQGLSPSTSFTIYLWSNCSQFLSSPLSCWYCLLLWSLWQEFPEVSCPYFCLFRTECLLAVLFYPKYSIAGFDGNQFYTNHMHYIQDFANLD